jgi:cytochrome c peroxidase
MARVQLGRQLTDQEVRQIVAFLGTLTGDVPKQFKEAPQLPVAAFQRP